MLAPKSKREIRASLRGDPFEGMIDFSASGGHPELTAAASYGKAVLQKSETYSGWLGGVGKVREGPAK